MYDEGMGGGCADGTCGLEDCESCGSCDMPCPEVCPPCPTSCGRLWVEGEYLQWWTAGFEAPPLVTTGVLSSANTDVLYGGGNLLEGSTSGARLELGYWLDSNFDVAFQASYLAIGDKDDTFSATSTGTPVLARPYFDVAPDVGAEAASYVAQANTVTGTVGVASSSEFHAIEAMLRSALAMEEEFRIDGMLGYRHARLLEDLTISESLNVVTDNATIDAFDYFETDNHFNGGLVGINTELRRGRWTFEMMMKLAMGSTSADVAIAGQQVSTDAQGNISTFDGSLYALPTNDGVYSESKFAVMPEIGVTLGWNFTRRLRVECGYTFLYLSQVARPGDQIDRYVNSTQLDGGTLDGAANPDFDFEWSDFWAHGVNLGLHYQF